MSASQAPSSPRGQRCSGHLSWGYSRVGHRLGEGLHREQGRVYPAEQFQLTLLLQTGLLTCSKAMDFPFLQKPLAQQACECPQCPG